MVFSTVRQSPPLENRKQRKKQAKPSKRQAKQTQRLGKASQNNRQSFALMSATKKASKAKRKKAPKGLIDFSCESESG
jgi:reverse gyrase